MSVMLQPLEELDDFYAETDPWGYETSADDRRRKAVLLSELPQRRFDRVLDIGCGHGFITRDLPGDYIVGMDVSARAIEQARRLNKDLDRRLNFVEASVFDLPSHDLSSFDLIVITGVLYPQYIGKSASLITRIVDPLLKSGGVLCSVHINEWASMRFPYLRLKEHGYAYRQYQHRLEIYLK